MEIKNDRLYAESHEWVLFENDTTATIGLSDFAQSELGDLVFVNLPQAGDTLTAGETFADVESVKAVSDIFSPVTGTVVAVNEALRTRPRKSTKMLMAHGCKVENITAKSALMDVPHTAP